MDEHRKMADEHTIGWIKYIDHNGEFPTEMVTCDPDDADAIPICRASSLISTASKSEKDGWNRAVEECAKIVEKPVINEWGQVFCKTGKNLAEAVRKLKGDGE